MHIPFHMRVEQRHSSTPFIAARVPEEFAGGQVTLIAPSGNREKLKAGSKPEYGPGGVEFLTYEMSIEPAFHIIEFGGLVFPFHHPYGATILAFDPNIVPPVRAAAEPQPAWDTVPDGAPPLEDIEIVDLHGTRQNLDWLYTTYGIELTRTPIVSGVTHVSRIVKLYENEGPAIYMVNVKDADGLPMEGVPIIRYWPGAPQLPAYEGPTSRWYDLGVYGPTNGYGDWACGVGSGDGGGAGTGVSALWTAKPGVPSDLGDKWLWLYNTEHRTMFIDFQIVPVEEEEPEEDDVIELLTEIRDLLASGYVTLPLASAEFA